MKRRLKSSVKYPFTTARGDFARNRGFEDPSEARKGKRVRFGDNERDGAPVVANSERYEAVQSPKCGAPPKTSEYAYFKNMRCGAGRDRSRAYCEENDQKKSKINHFFRETSSASDKLKPSTHGLNFSVSGERAGPSDHNIFHSPRPSKYDESDKIRSKELTNQIKKKSPLLPENVTPVGQSMFSSPFYKASEKEENQCSGNGIFSAKRQRLRKWAHSSHFEVEKLHLKGFDLVPLLLSRLFPEGNENNDSSKGVTVNSCKSLPVSKSNDLENRLDVSRKRDWDNDNNDSPKGVIVNSCKSLPVNKSNDLENRLDVSRKRDWDHDNIDSSKGVTANSCKSLPVSKSNDLDDLEYRLDVSRKRDWDSNNYDSSKGDTVNICELPTVSKSNDLENKLDISRKRDWDHDLYDSSKGDTVNICEFLTVSKSNDLLNRLYVSRKRDWDNDNYDSSKGDGVNICKSLPVSQYNDLENRLDVPRKRNWDNDLPKACSGRWGDIVLAEQDKFISGLPSNYHKENHLLDEFMIPDKRSKSHEYRSSHAQLGFPLCLPFESYRSSGSSHLNELDEFGSIIERQREPYGLLLEWDNELGQDRRNSSIVNHGIEKNVLTRLDNSWNVNSSLSSAYYLESNTGQSFSSKGCLMPDFEPAFDDVKCAMEEPGQFPLALPYGPKCLTLGEDRNGKNVLSSSNIISSYRDEDWLNMKVWDGKPLSKLWWKCTSAPDDHPSVFHPSQFPENENRLFSFSRLKEASIEEPFTPLYEGVFNRCFLSPLPRSSLNTFVNHPLLLDHVSEDSPNQELYFDEVMNWDREKYFRCTFGDTLCLDC